MLFNYFSTVLEIQNLHLQILDAATKEQARNHAEKIMVLLETDPSYGLSEKLVRWTVLQTIDQTTNPELPTFRVIIKTVEKTQHLTKASSRDEAVNKTQEFFYRKESEFYNKDYRWTLLSIGR